MAGKQSWRTYTREPLANTVSKSRLRGEVCEMCGKKFTVDQPDVNYHASSRIMHVHAHCARKAHIQL